MKVSDALTDIAEVSVNAALHLAYQIVAKRHGFPLDAEWQRCSIEHTAFVVIGYGKVGGIELGYGSDLIWSSFTIWVSRLIRTVSSQLAVLSSLCA